ncbi:MAG: outer membrane transport energization protein TonB [Nitrobacter sp.]|uniref:energy transducer TonB n=1 Tax=Nitrobacter sp. TaxID=29420 RepID=UPI00387DDF84
MNIPYRRITRHDLLRWGTCFVAMLSLHGAVAAALLMTPEEGDTYDTVTAIEVDFTTESFREAQARDVAPGEEQMQTDEAPPPQEKAEVKTEKEPEPEPPLPQVVEPDVALETPPDQKKPEEEKKDEKEKTPNATPPLVAASATTAPTAAAARKARLVSWKRQLALHLQRNKRYPREAQSHHETGTSKVTFVVDRQGRIVSSRIVKGSGSEALDRETLELLQRAQPLPEPPKDVGGTQFAFTMPILFEFR